MVKYAALFLSLPLFAQDETLPYRQIPDYPETYTAGTVAARVVDGLGFRFYWATESLRDQDLSYRPNEEARTIEETVEHIYGMSFIIVNTIKAIPNQAAPKVGFVDMRKAALENFKVASDLLQNSSAEEMEKFTMIFQGSSSTTEFPFWNLLNGPIADCLWHTGQIVSLRRSAGNPFNSKVSVLQGKVRE